MIEGIILKVLNFINFMLVIVIPVLIVKLLDVVLFKRFFKREKNAIFQIASYILILLLMVVYKKNI